MRRICITKEWFTLRNLYSIPLSLQVVAMVPEGTRFNKRLAEKIAEKCREPYASFMTYLRMKFRFISLRAAMQGFWGKRSDVHLQDLIDIDFSLIPRPTIMWSWSMASMTWHQLYFLNILISGIRQHNIRHNILSWTLPFLKLNTSLIPHLLKMFCLSCTQHFLYCFYLNKSWWCLLCRQNIYSVRS